MQAGFITDSILEINESPSLIIEPPAKDSFVAETLSGETVFELGAWLAAIKSFSEMENHLLSEESRTKAAAHNWSSEFRLTHSALLLCSKLAFQLIEMRKSQSDLIFEGVPALKDFNEISTEELYSLAGVLKASILIGEALLRTPSLKLAEWKSWCDTVNAKLLQNAAFRDIIRITECEAEGFLPEILKNSLEQSGLPETAKSDLRTVFAHIGSILKWLSVVGKMISRDKPLKPALLLYAKIFENIRDLTSFINRRLYHFSDETDELFGMLDGVSYVASIELRKVYQQELVGIVGIRPVPLVRARIEASHGLLNDSFQQTLFNFARFLNPSVELFRLFPRFRLKLDETLILRQTLWELLQAVQQAEQNPDEYPLDALNLRLIEFTETTINYLMYKDRETFERFVEEVVRTSNKQDLVPILHRFGAYLETLFGQVNMRAVVADRPFEYQK